MKEVIEILENLRNLSGNAQLDYLREHKDNKILKEVLYYTYNPDLKYNINEAKLDKASGKVIRTANVNSRDIEIINVELIMSDLEIVENRLNRIGKKAEMTKDKKELLEIGALKKIKDGLLQNIPVRKIELSEDELEVIKSFNLITLKPVIYVANVSEEDILAGGNAYYEKVCEYAKAENSEVVMICAKIESELVELNDDEKAEFLKELGIEESGLDQLIKKTYSLLGLATFFTVGSDEVKAWTFRKGMKAPQCAGIIHTDFERGFIRAEVTSYEDLVKYGSENDAKDNGKVRLEGKEYLMQDGDVCYFRFNV